MIPWSSFIDAEPACVQEILPLRESVLLCHFSATASRVSEYEECPMLNNACERRFALGQLSQSDRHFNVKHVDDMECTIDYLVNYYKQHSPFAPLACPPTPAGHEDLVGLTDPAPVADMPPFELDVRAVPEDSGMRASETTHLEPLPALPATPGASPPSPAAAAAPPPPPPRQRLSISCLVNAEPDQSVHRQAAIIPAISESPTSEVSNQYASLLPSLRLTLENVQRRCLGGREERQVCTTDDVHALLSGMLPPKGPLSDLSLASLRSFVPPYLLPAATTLSPAGHGSRIRRAVRKRRRRSPSLDGPRGKLASSDAAVAAKRARVHVHLDGTCAAGTG